MYNHRFKLSALLLIVMGVVTAIPRATYISKAAPLPAPMTTPLSASSAVSAAVIRVSLSSSGAQGNDASSFPSTNDDGRYVAFYSVATNLVAGDTNGASDIFVRDRRSGTTTRISVDNGGGQANSGSFHSAISADGHSVVFDSLAHLAGDTNGFSDIFVRNWQAAPS